MTIRELPSLKLRRKISIAKDNIIMSIIISPDERFLLCACENGDLAILSDPNIKKQIN